MPISPIGLPKSGQPVAGENFSGIGGGLGTGTAAVYGYLDFSAEGGGTGQGVANIEGIGVVDFSGVGGGLGTGVAALDVVSTGQPADRDDDAAVTNWTLCDDGTTVRAGRISFYWVADSTFRGDMGPPIRTEPEDHDRLRARFELAGRLGTYGRIVEMMVHTGRAGDVLAPWQFLIEFDRDSDAGLTPGSPSA